MSTEEGKVQEQTTAAGVQEKAITLSDLIRATKKTEPDRAKDLIDGLIEQVNAGVVKWDKNLTQTLRNAIAMIDDQITKQLKAIMHNEKFTKLEGTWRGMHYLVKNSETCDTLKIRMLNVGKKDLAKDLEKAVEFDQSELFKKVYSSEYDQPGGEPYGVLIGDYEFERSPTDMDLLRNISSVAAAGFTPFVSAASPDLFGFDSWTDLAGPRDLASLFSGPEYIQWKSFRDTEDSRFVSLVMPKVLARLPYGKLTKPIEEFDYQEAPMDNKGVAREGKHEDYCWMNAAYVLGSRMTDTFAKTNWCTAIRGAEGGGKVENLPVHDFKHDDGDKAMKCPSEIAITERRDAELSKLGFLPLCHYKNTDYAVFFGGQTTQLPKKYDQPDATANAAISARLPYILATSRIAHYLKVMGRDKIASFMEVENMQEWLTGWVRLYVNSNPNAGQEIKARYPLREAKIEVKPIPGKPGSYEAVAWLRPWLQFEELTASMRLVAEIPKGSG